MLIKNTTDRFGIVAILLHWIIAILIIGMLTLGLYMTELPIGLEKLKFYGWHKEFGILILMLVIVRFIWRLSNLTPTLAILPWWEKLGARIMHWALYGFMFAMPMTGWLMSSAAGLSVSFFGLFTLPNFVMPNEQLFKLLAEIHEWLGFGLIAAIIGHTAAALKHRFIDKDNILRRILWP